MNITKDTVIGDILMTKPEAIGTLMSFGMGCIMCPSSQTETLEEACLVHGLQVEPLLEAINNIKKED